jgi:hypothetical protein
LDLHLKKDNLPGPHPGTVAASDRTNSIHVCLNSPGGVKKGKHSGLEIHIIRESGDTNL